MAEATLVVGAMWGDEGAEHVFIPIPFGREFMPDFLTATF
jgi:hypothetical protein